MNRILKSVSSLAALSVAGALAVPARAAAFDTPAPRKAAAATTGLPPLLDRELFFGNPEIAAAQLSPDGRYIGFLKPWKETRNVWVKKTPSAELSCRSAAPTIAAMAGSGTSPAWMALGVASVVAPTSNGR